MVELKDRIERSTNETNAKKQRNIWTQYCETSGTFVLGRKYKVEKRSKFKGNKTKLKSIQILSKAEPTWYSIVS